MTVNHFKIADHIVEIAFQRSDSNNLHLLPSFSAFSCENRTKEPLFKLVVDDSILPAYGRQLIRKFDTGNGDTVVYSLPDGGYQFVIKDIYGRECALLICKNKFLDCCCALKGDWTMRSFGLNDSLMLIFAFAGAYHQTLLIHASCVLHNGKAYPFTAKSGTGKSTHSSLWMKHIEGAELLNDDNPIIRIIDGRPVVYGSPWSGKTPCYRNRQAQLGAVVQIERATTNYIERLPIVQAFAALLPACSSMKWDAELNDLLCNSLSAILQTTPVYAMHCLPDEEAARVCHQMLTR